MDIYCPKCGEPWDIDSIHEEAQERGTTFEKVLRQFQVVGCSALGEPCSEPDTETDDSFGLTKAQASSALYEMLGDDIDGAASMLDDMFG